MKECCYMCQKVSKDVGYSQHGVVTGRGLYEVSHTVCTLITSETFDQQPLYTPHLLVLRGYAGTGDRYNQCRRRPHQGPDDFETGLGERELHFVTSFV